MSEKSSRDDDIYSMQVVCNMGLTIQSNLCYMPPVSRIICIQMLFTFLGFTGMFKMKQRADSHMVANLAKYGMHNCM